MGIDVSAELYVYADALSGEYTLSRYPGRKPRVYNGDTAIRCVEYARRIIEFIRSASKDLARYVKEGDKLLGEYVNKLVQEVPESTIVLFGSRRAVIIYPVVTMILRLYLSMWLMCVVSY